MPLVQQECSKRFSSILKNDFTYSVPSKSDITRTTWVSGGMSYFVSEWSVSPARFS